jgi:glycerophosphoryl diester phosphodiesterase
MSKVKVWAHRGASAYAPENTLVAFEKAVEMHADGVETDVHLTLDGELVISHDETLERVSNGHGKIPDKTLKELKELDFSYGREGFKDVRMLTMREFLEFMKGNDLYMDIEMKYSGTRWDETNEKMAAMAKEFGMEDRIIYSSFRPEPLLKLQKMTTSGVGFLYDYEENLEEPGKKILAEGSLWQFTANHGFDAIHPDYTYIYNPEMTEFCKEKGILMNPWTIDKERVMKACYEVGVNAVITNKPDLALKVRREVLGY